MQAKAVRTLDEVETVARQVIDQYGGKRLASYGILDVTLAPYSADPTGERDATEALQWALLDARDARLVTFLPAGTYRVSDTLTCIQGYIVPPRVGGEERLRNDDFPCTIWGSTQGGRSRLLLAPNSRGFDDPANPKPVIFFGARDWQEPHDLQPNASLNQMVMSVDIEFGSGNRGAVGIDHQGANGSAVEDVRVQATGGFAGFRGAPGSGGSMSHLTVEGGEYGLYLAGTGALKKFQGSQPAPVVSFVTLRGQKRYAIFYDGRGPLTVVGGRIEGAGIRAQGWNRWDGALNLIDSVVSVPQQGQAITANQSIYLSNTYFEDAGTVVQLDNGPILRGSPKGWTHVREYAVGASEQNPLWVEGRRWRQPLEDVVLNSGLPPPDLSRQHAWIQSLPTWQDQGVANVREAPGQAKGDGQTDDTDAIQRAIDDNVTVLLPKGVYKISRPLRLKSNTRLIGIGAAYSAISPIESAPAFSDPANPSPLVYTVNDAMARTVLARVQLRARLSGSYALRWQAGRSSVVADVWFKRWPAQWGVKPADHPMVLIDGHGGGRWHNAGGVSYWQQGPNYRHFLVKGTREPLSIYMVNVEDAVSDYQAEFNDAENVTVYAMKAETVDLAGNVARASPPLLVRNSRRIRVFGHGGNASAAEGAALFRIENSADFLLANIAPQHVPWGVPPATWSTVTEVGPAGEAVRTPGTEWFVLYKRGQP